MNKSRIQFSVIPNSQPNWGQPTVPSRSQSLALITSEVDVDDDSEDEEEDDSRKRTSLNISVEVSGDENFDSMPNFITSPAARSRIRK